MNYEINVVIATIPLRRKLLRKTLASVVIQTLQPAAVMVEYDHERTGAAATKNRRLARVTTEWGAFLDDDDQFMPEHLEKLAAAQLFRRGQALRPPNASQFVPLSRRTRP